MICEMCGNDSSFLDTVLIDGAQLQVCPSCAKYGTKVGRAPPAASVEKGLERRQRNAPRDVYARRDTGEVLVYDFAAKIRIARQSQGMTPQELAQKINEKKSVLSKIESGNMRPDDRVRKKLERALNIKLMEKLEE